MISSEEFKNLATDAALKTKKVFVSKLDIFEENKIFSFNPIFVGYISGLLIENNAISSEVEMS